MLCIIKKAGCVSKPYGRKRIVSGPGSSSAPILQTRSSERKRSQWSHLRHSCDCPIRNLTLISTRISQPAATDGRADSSVHLESQVARFIGAQGYIGIWNPYRLIRDWISRTGLRWKGQKNEQGLLCLIYNTRAGGRMSSFLTHLTLLLPVDSIFFYLPVHYISQAYLHFIWGLDEQY